MSHPSSPEIWWKQPWPWIVIGLLTVTVVASIYTLYIAANTTDSLVADDYTKQGKGINQRLAKDKEAERLGVVLQTEWTRVDGDLIRIKVRFRVADSSAGIPDHLRMQLAHPTLANRDISASLVQIAPGVYQAQISNLSDGNWHSAIEDANGLWRVRGRLEVTTEGARL
jgi:hypothetical protein